MSYSAQVLADSPLAYWRLGEASGTTMNDSSGNARSGTHSGVTLGSTALQAGDTDTAATYPNLATTVSRVTNASWMNVSALTLEAIVKPTAVTGGVAQSVLIRDFAGGGSPNSVWRLRINGTNAEFLLWAGTLTTLTGAVTLSAGGTYHLAATYDGATMSLYVNGALDASVAKTGSMAWTYDITVGRLGQNSGTREPFNGVIDEAAFYGSALSSTRIAAHAAAVGGDTGSLGMAGLLPTLALGATYEPPVDASIGLTGPKMTGALSASYIDVVTASLAATGVRPTMAVSASYDPEPVFCTVAGELPVPTLAIGASRRVFIPPTTTESSDDILFGRYGIPVGQSVVKTDGHYVTTPYPWLGEIAGLTEGRDWFCGGRTYDIDSATAAALQADGYTLTEV